MSDLFLVSGGSGAIGSAICGELAARGYTPVIGYNSNHDAAVRVAQETKGRILALDMASDSSIAAACGELASDTQTLAGVVFAGSPPPLIAPFGKIESADLERQIQVNVKGPQRLLASLVRDCFRKNKKGTVVGILSKAMGDGIGSAASNMGSYIIAKYALEGMLAALAADYPWLRVAAYSPSYTETPMLTAFDPRFLDLRRAEHAFQTPKEVAAQVAALIV